MPRSLMSSAVFLESADSIRFRSRKEFSLRKRHLEMEVLLAILFGRRIGVSGAYSFDSSGFVEVAADVVRNRSKRGIARNPILLGLLPGSGPFRTYVASQMGRPKSEFILSGWPSLSDDQDRRDEFARSFLSSNPDSATDLLGQKFERDRLVDLIALASYFDESSVMRAEVPRIRLTGYIDELLALRLDASPPEERDAVAAIVEGIRLLRDKGVNLD